MQIDLIAIHAPQVDRHERSMPVVRVQDQVAIPDAARDFDRRGREKGEAPVIVRVVAARIAVDPRAVERWIMLEEQRLEVAFLGTTPAAHVFTAATALDRKRIAERFQGASVLARLAI